MIAREAALADAHIGAARGGDLDAQHATGHLLEREAVALVGVKRLVRKDDAKRVARCCAADPTASKALPWTCSHDCLLHTMYVELTA